MIKKTLLTTFFFCAFFSVFSQENKTAIIKKIITFIKEYSVTPGTSKTGKNSVIYFNKIDKVLDLDGFQIPLVEVKTTYYFSEKFSNHCVSFDCKSDDCIVNPQGENHSGFSAPFINKQKCYDFMELISQLRR